MIVPVGTVMAFAGEIDAKNEKDKLGESWLVCDGRDMDRTGYPDLFNAIGETYGKGNGENHFKLPDFRGMFLRGVDGGTRKDPDAHTRSAANGSGKSAGAGSTQNDEYKGHAHGSAFNINIFDYGSTFGSAFGSDARHAVCTHSGNHVNVAVHASGGSETRPRNVYVHYIIKAKNG